MYDANAWRLGFFDPAEALEYLVMRSNEQRFRDFLKQHSDRLRKPFYVTVVPKTLDVLECCLAFLPNTLPLFLILNGLEPWEQAFVERMYPRIPKFKLETGHGSVLYDRVLDMLVECNDSDFGVLDQDCFVLDGGFFSKLRIGTDFAISPFVTLNPKANITFPRTYFLFFNLSEIHRLREKYQISFKRCWTIPSRFEEPLKSLNLGSHNFPHEALGYFDNFQLIWAMALYEGLKYGRGPSEGRLLGLRRQNIVHVGAAHNYLTDSFRDAMPSKLAGYEDLPQLEREKFKAAVFSYYAHLRLLEDTDFHELKERYMPFFAPLGTSKAFLSTFRSSMSAGKAKEIDLTIRRLRRVRGSR